MEKQFSRTALLLGIDAVEQLHRARVAVFGVGGVVGYVVEALARSGVGHFELIDNDKVCFSNLNRQIIAIHKTIGQYKVDVMKERILDINPEAEVTVHKCFFLPENVHEFSFAEYDYIVDAVDTVTAKIELVLRAKEARIPVISSMGAGNKVNASAFRVADIYETKVCPLAKIMRRELKKRGVKELKVVYSEEMPLKALDEVAAKYADAVNENGDTHSVRRSTPGSLAFVPSVAGLIIAGEIVKDLTKQETEWTVQ